MFQLINEMRGAVEVPASPCTSLVPGGSDSALFDDSASDGLSHDL